MTCETITLPDGRSAIVCSRGRAKKPKCRGVKGCGRAAPFACDQDLGEGKTCDRKLCARHARIAGADLHLCPEHATLAGITPLYESDLPELPGHVLPSKYQGSCCLCGGRVEVEDRIHYHQKRVEHEACALRAVAALAPLEGAPPVVFTREENLELGKPLRLSLKRDGALLGAVVVPLLHRRQYFRSEGQAFGLTQDHGMLYTVEARPASRAEVELLERVEAEARARRVVWRRVEGRVLREGERPAVARPQGPEWPARERRQPQHSYLVLEEGGGAVWFVLQLRLDGHVQPNHEGNWLAARLVLDEQLQADLVALGALTSSA